MSPHYTSGKLIKERLAKHNYAPRKSLGQNFLIDENTLRKIVAQGNLSSQDLVLEIGPGLGALTTFLTEAAGQVVAVEYDRGLTRILEQEFAGIENFHLVNEDILQADFIKLLAPWCEKGYQYKVLANLPYYITTPVIFKLLESQIPWSVLVFLVQKEVAERITAKPGTKEYGALTVMLNFFGQTEIAGIVPKTVFYPAPKVDSAIVRITPIVKGEDWQLYPYLHQVVQAAFGQRRKTIANALNPLVESFGSRAEMMTCFNELGIDPMRRGETLTGAEFMLLARKVSQR